MKRFLLICIIVLCTPTIFAKDKVKIVCYQDLCYTINEQNHTAALWSYKKGKEIRYHDNHTDSWCYPLKSGIVDIVIPSEIYVKKEKYIVTEISNYAFSQCNIEKVVIPNTVTVIGQSAFSSCYLLRNITIPSSVVEIGYWAFFDCYKLASLIIPNSVKRMGGLLVANNDIELKEIIVPDEEVELIGTEDRNNKFQVELGAYLFFKGSCNVQKVKGNTFPFCPSYMVKHIEKTSPFFKKGYYEDQQKSFSFYAYEKAKSIISEWEKKKEYETIAQWQNRVTEQNRNMQVEKVINRLRAEYIDKNTPAVFKAEIGLYDADYQTFPVKVDGMNTIYVKVPYSDAESFKTNWNSVSVKPQYGVINDRMAVIDAKFYCGDKEYALSETYINESHNSLALNLPPLQLDLSDGNDQSVRNMPTIQTDNIVDVNIPLASSINSTTFAVIIGNEKYTQVAKAPYAQNDAKIFSEYCKKTLGVPVQNVRVYENATFGTMLTAINDIRQIVEAYQGNVNVIFYYAGHGVPNETMKEAYLLPVDADGRQTEACYPVGRLYKELGGLGAKNVVVFMDACFSGAQRGEGMLVSARGVALKVKAEVPQGNMIVFSAATGDETAYPYNEKGHGLFTYFLLKKLQETKGDCTLGELGEYIQQNVRQQSVVINRKSQTPTIKPSASVGDNWRNLKLK